MFYAKQKTGDGLSKKVQLAPTNNWKKAFANRLSCQWQDWKYRKIAQIEF